MFDVHVILEYCDYRQISPVGSLKVHTFKNTLGLPAQTAQTVNRSFRVLHRVIEGSF